MNKEKGISRFGLLVICALIIAAFIIGRKTANKPLSGIFSGTVELAKENIDKAAKTKDTVNKAAEAAKEAVKKIEKTIEKNK